MDQHLPRVRVVIQARMGSSRLPGKILAPLDDRPLLWHVVRRLAASATSSQWQVMVATTTAADDDRTADWCRQRGIACFRGDPEDVLARYLQATADLDDNEILIRATADNPLYCPRRTAAIVARHLDAAEPVDYTSIEGLSYVVPEVIRVGALRRMALVASEPYCREHVTPYFRQHPAEFRVVQLPPTWEGLRPEVRLTVDTPEELAQMRAVFRACANSETLPIERVYQRWRATLNPEPTVTADSPAVPARCDCREPAVAVSAPFNNRGRA
jgi:spore coat polysaccharide biosynthesis protein SpsF